MSSTFSPSLRIELIGDGDQSGIWGQTTNSNLGTLIEQAITGVQYLTLVDANYTLSSYNGVSDEARNAVIRATGTLTAQRDIIAPVQEKTYTIWNNTTGGYGIRIIGASGTGVVIPNGMIAQVFFDGTNYVPLQNGVPTNFRAYGNLSADGNLAVTGTSTFTGSSTFVGIPSGPTAAYGTNTTQLATTAFVQAAIPAGCILLWSGSIASIPSGWLLCNGSSGTPDLRDRFVVGAGSTYAVGATGGAASVTLATTNLPSHTHSISATGTTGTESQGHTHTFSGTSSGQNQNHVHTGTTAGMDRANPHAHQANGQQLPGFGFSGGAGDAYQAYGSTTTGYADINHAHTFTTDANNVDHTHTYGGTTSNISANHTHSVTVTGTSGATGSGTAFSILPPYYALAYIMKA